MAQGRMFNKSLIESARFIKMPISCQNLYFHLNLRADDDGIVEAYNVMRMVGATEDDLKVLVAKGFVTVLNDDLVSFINDWRVHNKLRPDRKVDSLYKDLLLQIVPDVKLLESKERADSKKTDVQRTERGQPFDGLGKDRLGKDRLGKDNKIKVLTPPNELLEIIDLSELSPLMKDTLTNWLTYKTERKQIYKLTGFKSLITMVIKNINKFGEIKVIELINECMANNWQGIIWEKLENTKANKKSIVSSADELQEMIARGEFRDD